MLTTLTGCKMLRKIWFSYKPFCLVFFKQEVLSESSSVMFLSNLFFSSPQEISMYAQVTHQKAEEIYSYIHYVFDMQMLPNSPNQGREKSDAWSDCSRCTYKRTLTMLNAFQW